MEQIIRRDGEIYYGEIRCDSIDDAYERFRDDYHGSIGREAFRRLDRLGQRSERIHGFGFCFSGRDLFPGYRERYGRTRYRLMGLVGISYCRIIGVWDLPGLSEEQYERWFDWAFSKGSGGLYLVGRKNQSGRTSKRLNKHYK